MITLDRTKFWDLYRDSFGSSTQPTVDSLNIILTKMETDDRLKRVSHHAYFLATGFHEAARGGNHFVPIKEGKGRPGSKAWSYQKKYWYTGFIGRGLGQVTYEENYRKIGHALGVGDLFVKNPDLLLQTDYAYDALSIGMSEGMFRKGHSLGVHLKRETASVEEYCEAREIINGDKNIRYPGNALPNGMIIAKYAKSFERILLASRIEPSSPAAEVSDPTKELDPARPSDEDPSPSPATDQPGGSVVDVPVVEAPAPPETTEKKIEKWSARWTMIPTTITGGAFAFLTWLKDSPVVLTIALVLAVALVAGVYMGLRQLFVYKRAKAANDMLLEDKRRAHEIQMALINAGASKDLNAVNLVRQEA